MRRITIIAGGLAALFVTAAAAAERHALVIANHSYADAPEAHSAPGDAEAVTAALKQAGYDVTTLSDLDRAGMEDAIRNLELQSGRHETLVVYYTGHAIRVDGRTMLAPVDASNATHTEAVMSGAPLDLLLDAAAGASDDAVVFLDAAQLDGFTPNDFSEPGLADITPPEGVLVVSAAAPGQAVSRGWWNKTSNFSSAIIEQYLTPGAKVSDAQFSPNSPIWTVGSLKDPDIVLSATEETASSDGGGLDQQLELELWRAAESTGKVADYKAYLDRFPNGVFSGMARNRIADLSGGGSSGGNGGGVKIEPPQGSSTGSPAADEDALGLSRSERIAIQRDLTQLGYDTKGIDSVFGPGTRNSIRLFQQSVGAPATGYLTRDQVDRLASEAKRDAAEKRQAEERRRAAQEADDNALWAETRSRDDLAAYSAYLDRYPDGLHAADAQAEVNRILDRQRRTASFRDRAAWEAAERSNDIRDYQAYLRDYPNGAFADLAHQRVDELQQEADRLNQRRIWQDRERALGLDQRDILSLEQRLAYLGFHPGSVDGRIDRDARAAISEYQSARRLEVTGYFDRPTVQGIMRETASAADSRAIIAGEAVRNLLNMLGN